MVCKTLYAMKLRYGGNKVKPDINFTYKNDISVTDMYN